MNENIDNYGLIGDTGTAALISASGNLRWLCWPDFDSEACFASLLGTDENGVWSLGPALSHRHTRRYIPGTLVLQTTYKHLFGATVSVTDFMPKRDGHSTVLRIVRGLSGQLKMRTRFAPRLDYGNAQPRIDQDDKDCWSAVAGPNRITLRTNVELQQEEGDLEGEWVVKAGETYFFILQQSVSYAESPAAIDALQVERETATYWSKWISKSTYQGRYKEAVDRSLLTLAALTNSKSGGFVAAPTTSLPEKVGGIRNWDYRFCWLRDTTFSLISLTHCGFTEEAKAWLNWLSRSVQGSPAALKIMYGITGKREHSEWTANWLSGYKGSRPSAHRQ